MRTYMRIYSVYLYIHIYAIYIIIYIHFFFTLKANICMYIHIYKLSVCNNVIMQKYLKANDETFS